MVARNPRARLSERTHRRDRAGSRFHPAIADRGVGTYNRGCRARVGRIRSNSLIGDSARPEIRVVREPNCAYENVTTRISSTGHELWNLVSTKYWRLRRAKPRGDFEVRSPK